VINSAHGPRRHRRASRLHGLQLARARACDSPAWRRRADAAAPGSGWPALGDALAHINWAYIRWLADPAGTTDEHEGPVKSWGELEAYRRRVRGHSREYLDSLGNGELLTPREMNVDGETLLYRPADIFVHVLLHERQHHGDVNTLLYQLGIEAPIVEYRFSLPGGRA
jgi:uncharacterized damage-inducible protein DinB